MVISFSLTLLLGVVLFFLARSGNIKWGPAIVAILFGFSLASTGAADPIRDFLESISNSVSSVDDSINSSGP
ncbi:MULTISPECIES: hypothetical protein [Streptomyces]|uniref:Uncharacterized protein n=3 Tax=Streptomyces TaxID=1883 RepID=A0A1I6UQ86_9ACTN|nr:MULTISPECIES: hypothetical protein [Streptomyces]MCK1813799.1 hypothetical protein [Streptomyces sp. XM4011]QKV69144.1 hypothetical protein HUT13_10380 [Streptomyces harbinensis]UWM49168.1 hypothetical protein N0X72_09105 [Streptomyces carpaticus]SFT03611.1 hypothetical protein SAMN05444716_10681 [Streptomyces harbinensis]